MTSTKYIGMDVHTESISIAVRNSIGKIVMECVIETKASTILQFINGLSGDLRVTFEEGTWATWLYDFHDRSLSRVKKLSRRASEERGCNFFSDSSAASCWPLGRGFYSLNRTRLPFAGADGFRPPRRLSLCFPASLETYQREHHELALACPVGLTARPGRPRAE